MLWGLIIAAAARCAEFVRVEFVGKAQQQEEDDRFYTVVSRIQVFGKALPLVPPPMGIAMLFHALQQPSVVHRLIQLHLLPDDRVQQCAQCSPALEAVAELVRHRLRYRLVRSTAPCMAQQLQADLSRVW